MYENPNNPEQKLFGPFNETTGNYEIYSIITNATTPIEKGVGYRVARDASEDGISGTSLTFFGEIETTAVTKSITTLGPSFNGWNLIGNPFTSYIDFDTFFNYNKVQLNGDAHQAIYGYNGNASNRWTILNNLTTGQLIAPGQGFFVKSKTGGGIIPFNPLIRVSGNSNDFIAERTTSAHFGYIKLKANATNSEYLTDIYFNSNATLGLDPGYDAALYSNTPPPFSIYSFLVEENTGIPFTIQALNDNAVSNVTVSIGIHANQGQEITFSIHETDLPDYVDIYLEDTANNSFTLLNAADYTFTSDTNLSGAGRFYLRFESDALTIKNPSLDTLKITTNQNEKIVEITGQLERETVFKLYDIHGRVILTKNLDVTATQQKIDVNHLSAGIYIVELKTDLGNKRIQKLIIK